jgi:hypothetical protein
MLKVIAADTRRRRPGAHIMTCLQSLGRLVSPSGTSKQNIWTLSGRWHSVIMAAAEQHAIWQITVQDSIGWVNGLFTPPLCRLKKGKS